MNLAGKEDFDHIALTIIAFEQEGLLSSPSDCKGGTGQLNGYALPRKSAFTQTLIMKIATFGHGSEDDRIFWHVLRLLKIIRLSTFDVDLEMPDVLNGRLYDNPTIVGTLLSICSNSNFKESDRASKTETYIYSLAPEKTKKADERFLEAIAESISTLVKDHQFLEGLEDFLYRLST